MAIDRNLAHELSDNGLLLENGAHLSSGSGTPTHSGLAGDWYFKASDATVWRLAANGNAWARLSATDVPFVNTGTSIRGTTVDAVLKEFRGHVVYDPDFITTSLDGVTNLTEASKTLQVLTGSATGHLVLLPDATTLFVGEKHEIANQSSQPIVVKDYAGTFLAALNPGDVLIATLRANGTTAGVWILLAISSIASGVQAYNMVSSSSFSISSASDTLVTGSAITPPSGTYGAWFSADLNIGTNNRIAQCVFYRGGAAIADTRRSMKGTASNFKTSLQSLGIISLNGSQEVDVRVNVDGGTVTLTGRSFLLIRLGAAT